MTNIPLPAGFEKATPVEDLNTEGMHPITPPERGTVAKLITLSINGEKTPGIYIEGNCLGCDLHTGIIMEPVDFMSMIMEFEKNNYKLAQAMRLANEIIDPGRDL